MTIITFANQSGQIPLASLDGNFATPVTLGLTTMALGQTVSTVDSLALSNASLGTPSSGTLTNCTFPTLNQNTTGTAANVTGTVAVANGGTGVITSTGSGSAVLSTGPTLVTPALGTPVSGNLSSCTVDGTDAVGFRNVPQNLKALSYTCVLADAGKHMFNTVSGVNWTIPANSSVAYPVGTVLTFINGNSASLTILITTDTLQLVNTTTTGTRTLATNGMATAIKVTATKWYISGLGLT